MANDQFNIRWNNYTSVLQNVFRKLLEGEQFVDVTLACEGQSIKCHRLILSACSTYFDRILTDNPSSNLVIYLKDMKFWELRALVTFMYNGEVSISQQKLTLLCKAAEALKIKGLANDPGLTDGELDRMDEEEIEDGRFDGKMSPMQRENHRGPVHGGQPKSLLRQHNNLSAFAAAAAAANRQPQQIKRKIISQPPKLVKMQRVERPTNGAIGNTSAAGGNLKPNQLPISVVSKMPQMKKAEPDMNKSTSGIKDDGEDNDNLAHETVVDSSMKEDADNATCDIEEITCGAQEVDGGDENDSLGSEGDDSPIGQASVRPNKIPMKYGKEVRDSALSALQSGMTLRECSETFGIPKKTLSKWKSREMNNGEEDGSSPTRAKDGIPMIVSGIALPPKTTMGAPIDSADRAERLKKATDLALSGVTVRQAAAHFEIPRTTLCAYMKRRGLAAKRNFLPNNSGTSNNTTTKRMPAKQENNSAEANEQSGNASHYEDFPFLGISELMDEMGQANYDGDGYADGEEEYSEK